MERAAFTKKQGLFTCKMGLNLMQNLVNCFTWSITVCGSETWTAEKVDLRLKVFNVVMEKDGGGHLY